MTLEQLLARDPAKLEKFEVDQMMEKINRNSIPIGEGRLIIIHLELERSDLLPKHPTGIVARIMVRMGII